MNQHWKPCTRTIIKRQQYLHWWVIALSILIPWVSAQLTPKFILYDGNGHTGEMYDMAVTGDYLITVNQDKFIKVWNVTTGELIRSLAGHTRSVLSVEISENGFFYTTAWDDTLKKWSLSDWSNVWTHSLGITYPIRTKLYTDNLLVIGYDSGYLQLFDLLTRTVARVFPGHTATINSLMIIGNDLYSGDQNAKMKIWDITTAALKYNFPDQRFEVKDIMRWNDKLVSLDYDFSVFVWTNTLGIYTKREYRIDIKCKTGALFDNELYVGGDDGLRILDLSAPDPVASMSQVSNVPTHVIIAHQNQLISFDSDFILRRRALDQSVVWQVQPGFDFSNIVISGTSLFVGISKGSVWEYSVSTGGRQPNIFTPNNWNQDGPVTAIDATDQFVFAGYRTSMIVQWSRQTQQVVLTIPTNADVVGLGILGQAIIAITKSSSLKTTRFQVGTGTILGQLEDHPAVMKVIAVSATHIVTGDELGNVWAFSTTSYLRVWHISVSLVREITIAGPNIYIVSQQNVFEYSLIQGVYKKNFLGPSQVCSARAIQDWLFMGLCNGNMIQWNLAAATQYRTFVAHPQSVYSIITYNASIFSASAAGSLKEWNIPELRPMAAAEIARTSSRLSTRTSMQSRSSRLTIETDSDHGENGQGSSAEQAALLVSISVVFIAGLMLMVPPLGAIYYMHQYPPWVKSRRNTIPGKSSARTSHPR